MGPTPRGGGGGSNMHVAPYAVSIAGRHLFSLSPKRFLIPFVSCCASDVALPIQIMYGMIFAHANS